MAVSGAGPESGAGAGGGAVWSRGFCCGWCWCRCWLVAVFLGAVVFGGVLLLVIVGVGMVRVLVPPQPTPFFTYRGQKIAAMRASLKTAPTSPRCARSASAAAVHLPAKQQIRA